MPGHLPVGLLLASYVLAHLFVRERRRAAFFTLLGGSFTHLLMDSFQWHASGGEPIFWPFTWNGYEIGLVPPEASLAWIPALLVASAVVETVHQAAKAFVTRRAAERRADGPVGH